ncbi:desampylase [Haloglomus litoreum]|uniref:desampylase n=1 Tax=Haloglomus litoreum TaxID=3034026 RepID=UPI0023E7E5A8|nr:desampylase [Haloglomus sp. DT116]
MLRLSPAVYEDMVAHARGGAPAEVCGILAGTHGDESDARASARATNAADAPRNRYALDPAEQLELMRDLEAGGDAVVGFYHSHPRGPPAPSDVDAHEATWEGYSYVIVSLGRDGPDVRSWRWTGERFEREAVEVGALS